MHLFWQFIINTNCLLKLLVFFVHRSCRAITLLKFNIGVNAQQSEGTVLCRVYLRISCFPLFNHSEYMRITQDAQMAIKSSLNKQLLIENKSHRRKRIIHSFILPYSLHVVTCWVNKLTTSRISKSQIIVRIRIVDHVV